MLRFFRNVARPNEPGRRPGNRPNMASRELAAVWSPWEVFRPVRPGDKVDAVDKAETVDLVSAHPSVEVAGGAST